MITIRRLVKGAGFRYLMDSVAVGDGRADHSSSLTRYYAESGTPPGVFVGGGLDALGLERGQQVTEEHLERMLVEVTNPVTGDAVGNPPRRAFGTVAERVERRLARLPKPLRGAALAQKRAKIEREERAKQPREAPHSVAGFDLTFSPPKSVSVAWALADQGTKAVFYECHRRAIDYALGYAERTMFHSRSGKDGVLQEDIEGVIAAAFTHWDSRSGDPQLHDHVICWNRARSTSDGQWRTLDSRGLFKQMTTLSELYDGVLTDYLTDALGVGWDRQVTRGGKIKHEIAGVPDTLLREFSRRRQEMDRHEDQLVAGFVAAHGRAPTHAEGRRLAQLANLATRGPKSHRSLEEMTDDWQRRAAEHLDLEPVAWVTTLKDRCDLPPLRSDDLADGMLGELAGLVCDRTADRRSTFSRAHVLAEVHRQLQGVRFASPDDRETVGERCADLALADTVQVTAPELHHTPDRYRRIDGTTRLRPADHKLFTTHALLDAERRLFDLARRRDAATVPAEIVADIADRNLPDKDHGLSVDQAFAVEKIVTSGRGLDVLVGPAGTGKTTTLAGLRHAWEAAHGTGSVVGLAPSAAAAEVLADELGIDCENTTKWLYEHHSNTERRDKLGELRQHMATGRGTGKQQDYAKTLAGDVHKWDFHEGQLVIVDEASMAGTFALNELADAADQAGAKLLLVGDDRQLDAVDAGGMFRSLVRDRGDLAPELSDVRRFVNSWERAASVQLRVGDTNAIDTYQMHGRIAGGERDDMLNAIYDAWRRDVHAGKDSLMIAADSATVRALCERARAERIVSGKVADQGVDVAAGMTAGVGDQVITRENNRLLATGTRFVANGDRWTVAATNRDGSIVVQRTEGAGKGGKVVLPADYVTEHVELAYAVTAHRAQGRTVDTCHVFVTPTTTREILYVAATRGRQSNRLYVDTCYDPDPETGHPGAATETTARAVLAAVIDRQTAELGAHDQIAASWDTATSIPVLHAEYSTLARAAQADRWDQLISSTFNSWVAEQVRASQAYGPLTAALRDAEARGLDVDTGFPQLVAAHTLADAADIASVLHARVERWAEQAGSRRQAATDLIAGLIPRARGVTDPAMQRALTERDEAIRQRAANTLDQAIQRQAGWVRRLGTPPTDPTLRAAWNEQAICVAAYRERWNIGGQTVIDRRDQATSIEQIGHQKRAQQAVQRAIALSHQDQERQTAVTAEEYDISVVRQPEGIEL